MLRIIDVETGEPIAIADALQIDDDLYLSPDDLMARLMNEQAAGTLRIEPSGDALQRAHVKGELQRYLQTARQDGVRSFAADRRGGRVNVSRLSRMMAADNIHKRETIMSIQRYLSIEGPAAYRSQVALLVTLDPTIDESAVAAEAAAAVSSAVIEGAAIGRRVSLDRSNAEAVAQEGEQAS